MYCNYYEEKKNCTKDFGPEPLVINIDQKTDQNNNYRNALWTGDHLQVTLMSIGVGESIGLEMHECVDQFIKIEEGYGLVKMGNCKECLNFQKNAKEGYCVIVPAKTWHNLINIGNCPLKLYSIYAPPNHRRGVCQKYKEDEE